MPVAAAAVALGRHDQDYVYSFSNDKHDGDGDSKLRQWSSLIGIVTAIVGNVLISFALNIQRYAHIRIDRELENSKAPWRKGKSKSSRPRRYGTQQSDIAEERAELNLTAPADGQAKSNGIPKGFHDHDEADETEPLNRSFHSERTLTASEKDSTDVDRKSYLRSPYWWAGIILMTVGEAGNFLAYGFAPASIVSPLGVVALVSNCVIAPFMLKEHFRPRDFWGVLVAIAGAVTVVLSAKTSEGKMGPHDVWDAIARWEFLTYLGITAALIVVLMWASGKYGDRTILIDVGLVGLFGGYTALSTKGVASLLSDTLFRALTFPITYLLVAILVLSALAQIRYINRALQRFDSTQVIPTQFVCFTLSVIIGSAVLYRDFEKATADRVGKFIGGCVLTFLGVYLITSGRTRQGEEEDYLDEDEEGGIGLIDEEASEENEPIDRISTNSTSGRAKLQLATTFEGQEDGHISSHRGTSLRTPPRPLSASSSSVPSIAVTPSPQPTPNDLSAASKKLAWLSSEERLVDTPLPQSANSPARGYREPPRLRSTQSSSAHHFSPAPPSPQEPPSVLLRTPSAPEPTTPAHATSATSPARAEPLPSSPLRPEQTKRGSISGRFLPGPLFSPLNSGLSAIVADSLRRGEGSPGEKRRRSILRRGKSQRHPDDARRQSVDISGTSQDPPGQVSREDEPRTGDDGTVKKVKGRLRSLSDTFGMWRVDSKKRRKDESDGNTGEGDRI